MKVSLWLLLISASGCSCMAVVGETGQTITLPCEYDIESNGARPVCWNRGVIPSQGCNNKLISIDGVRVNEETRISSRYQLLGKLEKGDVSLTILNITEADAGRYGCRVDIWGWFNDEKHHFDLSVVPQINISPSSPPPSSSSSSSSSGATAATGTTGHMTSTDTPLTVSLADVGSAEQGDEKLTVILVSVLFGLVFLVTAGGLFIIGRRWRRLKLPQPRGAGSVGFSSTSSSLQLHSRSSAVDNIYQMDEGEYDYCP
ncbi:hepatitis A virus cellular receptor 1 isoform X2 [Salarias fasciatus]|uniref:hepatitis A virus cellular receptor 1 isoform X2 n=1 Tax=Salarias fasciatus TaxID=181472 RepID=UPI00117671AA|nr:hepatitis A virus cellular receptor 1 homolog isoform X2 [Salarias fasciatus]